jgi:hypothetical protein
MLNIRNKLYVPQQFGLDLVFDPLNAAGNNTYPSNGATIAHWRDLSGMANHWAQPSGALQPTFHHNVINGQPVVRFNGAQWMTMAHSANNAYTGAMTIICVYSTPNVSPAATGRIITKISSWGISYASTNVTFSFTGPYMATGLLAANNTFYNIGAIYNGSSQTAFYRNGSLYQTVSLASTMPVTTNALYLGSRDGVINFINGDIAFLAVKFGAIAAPEFSRINYYLNSRFQL